MELSVLVCLHRLQRHSLPNQVLIKLRRCANEVSAFMCSGKEFQIQGLSDLRLFVSYVFVFVLTTVILFGRLADKECKQKRSCVCVGFKTFSVLKISSASVR